MFCQYLKDFRFSKGKPKVLGFPKVIYLKQAQQWKGCRIRSFNVLAQFRGSKEMVC